MDAAEELRQLRATISRLESRLPQGGGTTSSTTTPITPYAGVAASILASAPDGHPTASNTSQPLARAPHFLGLQEVSVPRPLPSQPCNPVSASTVTDRRALPIIRTRPEPAAPLRVRRPRGRRSCLRVWVFAWLPGVGRRLSGEHGQTFKVWAGQSYPRLFLDRLPCGL